MNDNQNTNDSNPPNEDQVLYKSRHLYDFSQNQGNFETDSNWTDVRSQQDDDDILFIEDEEINKIEDEIFDEDDEDEESKKDGLTNHQNSIAHQISSKVKGACRKR